MSEAAILKYMKGYGFDHPSLEAAFKADPQVTLEKLAEASYNNSPWFTPEVLDFVLHRFDAAPGRGFWILHNLAANDDARTRALMDHFQDRFARHPQQAQEAVFYVAANNPKLLRGPLVDLITAHAPGLPYQAYQTLQYVLAKRPELIHAGTVKGVVDHLALAPNQAFYFIREVVKARPEFTPLCTVALFECVFHAPQPWLRREMLQDILSIATRSHVQTGLERALREPPTHGSRGARILMAILFRQSSRALQRVLLEALDLAAQWPAMWEYLRFLIQTSDPKQVSTAHAERFLDGAYRLNQIVSPYQFERILVEKLSLENAPEAPFPAHAAFLNDDAELSTLHRRILLLASRFGAKLRLSPLREFRERTSRLRREQQALQAAQTTRRLRRKKSLEERLAAQPGPGERRELAKKVGDALRAEAVEMAQRAIDAATKDAYREAIRRVLGRDIDVDTIEPAVLPAFLYHARLGRMPRNRKYLARLIEDRIEKRPHDWMRGEPAAATWAETVKKKHPGARLERWRAEFTRQYSYRPEDAAREKRRRVERDLEQTRALFARIEVEGMEKADTAALREKFLEVRTKGKDPAVVEEIQNNLERIRIAEQQDDSSDYEGKITLEVETDPFQVLFMGEFGFASCLSLRGSNVWSAVSNAIDVDKAVLWAKDPSGNIVGRRLVALTPDGVLSYRTYTNRHGLSLDGFFEKFIEEYAAHCGTPVTHHGSPGPLLSDDWYDDGAI